LPEIFASRRQAVLLIPSALPYADLLKTIIHDMQLGWAANPRTYIKPYFHQKIKYNFSSSEPEIADILWNFTCFS